MKRFIISLALILPAICLWAQSTTLTFTALDQRNAFVALEKVVITDVTQNWQDTIYYPDTVYVMETVGIDDYDGNLPFALSQNVPNPFAGTTDLTLQMPASGKVFVEVNDLYGRKITSFNSMMPAGKHTLRVQLTTPQTYILTARSGKDRASIKMVNTGNTGINRIQYSGAGQFSPLSAPLKSVKSNGKYIFHKGDSMIYVGYAKIDGVEYLSKPIRQTQKTSQNFLMRIPLPVEGLPCPNMETVTDYDGNVYNTVLIGKQCWMNENLRTRHFSNGDSITLETTTSFDVPYCYRPNDNEITVTMYGYLYNWGAVMHVKDAAMDTVQGICPTGWHVPTVAEWSELTKYVQNKSDYHCGDNADYIAKALSSTRGWNLSTHACAPGNSPSENNAAGFSALPAGSWSGVCSNFSKDAYLWSATELDGNKAYILHFNYGEAELQDLYPGSKANGFSVRCLRN